jgi:dienelactone hydrolase
LKRYLLIGVSFVVGALGLFSTTAAAQQAVTFPASEPFTSGEIALRAELYKPQGAGPYPAVILMHGCGGWQPSVRHALRIHARYLVKNGFAVLSLDSFGPRKNSGGEVCKSFRNLREARHYRTYDAFDAMRYLRAQAFVDASNVFLMGQSNGGSVALIAANAASSREYNRSDPPFRAVVAYYPWCGAFGSSRVTLASPLLVLGGGADDWVPPQECQRTKAVGADYQVTIYPEAAHSFDLDIMTQRYLGKLVGGDARATSDSREKMLAFFNTHRTDSDQLAENTPAAQ